jgi:hypothetical protein
MVRSFVVLLSRAHGLTQTRLVAFAFVHGLQIAPPYIVHSMFCEHGSVQTVCVSFEAAPASSVGHAPASFGAASGRHLVPLQSSSEEHVCPNPNVTCGVSGESQPVSAATKSSILIVS